METKHKKTSQAAHKGGKSKVHWILDDAFLNRRALRHISQKMQKICELKSRLDIEAPNLSLEKIMERMRKRKMDLIKKVSMNDMEKKEFLAGFRSPNPGEPDISDQASLTYGEYYARRSKPDLETILSDYWADKTCEVSQGSKRYDWFFPHAWKQAYLNHNSEESFYVEWELYETYGSYMFAGELNDDASIWRDDSPDWIAWGQEIGWILPKVECDSKVICELTVKVVSEFTNSADDGGELMHNVTFGHSDKYGNLPREAKIGGIYDVIVDRQKSDHSDSGRIRYKISFDVNKGVEGKVVIIVGTVLQAQDGLVEVYGSWTIDRSIDYQILPK